MKEYKHEFINLYAELALGFTDPGKPIPKKAAPLAKMVEPILNRLDNDEESLRFLALHCVKMVEAAKRDKILG